MPEKQNTSSMSERDYADTAITLRLVLGTLGFKVPQCEPGVPEWCGSSYRAHAGCYAVALRAVADHLQSHIGMPQETQDIVYADSAARINASCNLG